MWADRSVDGRRVCLKGMDIVLRCSIIVVKDHVTRVVTGQVDL